MNERNLERLHSMGHAATDISRWVLQMALMGRISPDRLRDIEIAARRLADHAAQLRESKQ